MNPQDSNSVEIGAGAPGRRAALQAAVATAAALAGAGFAWWKFQPHEVETGADAKLWEMTFETPSGASLAMKQFLGKTVVVNFWATWCPPCVEELPLLERFTQQNAGKGVQVIGLAVDQVTPVRNFLAKMPVTFPIGMAGAGGTELGRSLGNAVGGLPFTVAFARDGKVLDRKMGKVSEADLRHWALKG